MCLLVLILIKFELVQINAPSYCPFWFSSSSVDMIYCTLDLTWPDLTWCDRGSGRSDGGRPLSAFLPTRRAIDSSPSETYRDFYKNNRILSLVWRMVILRGNGRHASFKLSTEEGHAVKHTVLTSPVTNTIAPLFFFVNLNSARLSSAQESTWKGRRSQPSTNVRFCLLALLWWQYYSLIIMIYVQNAIGFENKGSLTHQLSPIPLTGSCSYCPIMFFISLFYY